MPGWQKVSRRDLVVGGRYLHWNQCLVREIDAIEGGIVCWHDQNGPGRCGQSTFIRKCIRVLGAAEVESSRRTKVVASMEAANGPSEEAKALAAYVLNCNPLTKLRVGSRPQAVGSRLVSAEELGRLMAWTAKRLDLAFKLKEQGRHRYELLLREYRAEYARKAR